MSRIEIEMDVSFFEIRIYKYHIYIERKIVFNLKLKYKKSSLNHKNM